MDAILVNSGHWELPYFPYGPDAVNKSLEQLESLEGILPHGRKPIWMTTTKFLYGGGSDTPYTGNDSGYLAAKQLGWPILDRFGMTVTLFDYLTERHLAPNHTMYIDRLHFRNYVNREFVNMVTSMLCSVY